jgi:uncharacterized C2H2 Zn-finger protein
MQMMRKILGEPRDPKALHKHKCPKCGHIWEHENDCVNHIPAHTCKCGRRQWDVYKGSESAELKSCATIPKLKMTDAEWERFCEEEDKACAPDTSDDYKLA